MVDVKAFPMLPPIPPGDTSEAATTLVPGAEFPVLPVLVAVTFRPETEATT